ncbi:MAG: hypothetical protein RSB71_03330 [Bacilli bacterium]
MDIVVIVIVLGLVAVMIFKKFKSSIYYIAMIDIFLKIVSFIGGNIAITRVVTKYFPSGIDSIIKSYSSGIFTTVLLWVLFVVYIIFEYYLITSFFKKGRR